MTITLERLEIIQEAARSVGTDKEYLEWVRRQPSAISGKFSEWLEDIGEWRNPACHVRRANQSGIAKKPEFSAIPLTHEEHDDQSRKGEAYCLGRHSWAYPWCAQKAKDKFDSMLMTHLIMFVNWKRSIWVSSGSLPANFPNIIF